MTADTTKKGSGLRRGGRPAVRGAPFWLTHIAVAAAAAVVEFVLANTIDSLRS